MTQPFSTERFELEKNSPRSRRFLVTFKFALVPQNAQILGIFKISLKSPFFVFAHLLIHFLVHIFSFERYRAEK